MLNVPMFARRRLPRLAFDPIIFAASRTLSNDNRTILNGLNGVYTPKICLLPTANQIYVELKIDAIGAGDTDIAFGLINSTTLNHMWESGLGNYNMYQPEDSFGTYILPGNSQVWPGVFWVAGDVCQLAYDTPGGTIKYGLNDTWTGTYSVPTSGMMIAVVPGSKAGTRVTLNSGVVPFGFTPPIGFSGID